MFYFIFGGNFVDPRSMLLFYSTVFGCGLIFCAIIIVVKNRVPAKRLGSVLGFAISVSQIGSMTAEKICYLGQPFSFITVCLSCGCLYLIVIKLPKPFETIVIDK